METHVIPAGTHGRYLVDKPDGAGPFPMLIGFHGYGESAQAMLDALAQVREQRPWLIVSVQALSRFYSRVNAVVASWMTREDRELAITDNLDYVRAVVAAIRAAYHTTDTIVYAGFSQGVAMAYRAAAFASSAEVPRPRGVILLAGDVPPDVAPAVGDLPPLLIGRGTEDYWYTEPKATADLETLRKATVPPVVHVFTGGHVWEPSFIARAGQFLDEVERLR